MTTIPVFARLKDGRSVPSHELASLLAGAWTHKAIPSHVLAFLLQESPRPFAHLLAGLWLRDAGFGQALLEALDQSLVMPTSPCTYRGTASENDLIDRWVRSFSNRMREGERATIGWGTTFHLSLVPHCQLPPSSTMHTPIVILGAGPSGLLTARVLQDVGFRKIIVIDQQGVYGGIWNRPEIQMARANPLSIRYQGPGSKEAVLPPAPGPGTAIREFLMQLVGGMGSEPLPAVQRAKILAVVPGDLWHSVLVRDETGERLIHTPLLINCLGVGEPLPLSSPRFMYTDAEAHVDSRWQEPLTFQQLAALQGQRLVFISLSNSTLTMLQQVQALIDQGCDLSYTVLTHHSRERLAHPKALDLYRNLNGGLLTLLAGDLPPVHRAFLRVRDARCEREHLIPEVHFWTVWPHRDGTRSLLVQRRDGRCTQLDFARLYALTGYGHQAPFFKRMGLIVTGERAHLDFDGEVHAASSNDRRLHRGYFALGPVAIGQPNAAILPGILYRVGELVPTVLCRAAEYTLRP